MKKVFISLLSIALVLSVVWLASAADRIEILGDNKSDRIINLATGFDSGLTFIEDVNDTVQATTSSKVNVSGLNPTSVVGARAVLYEADGTMETKTGSIANWNIVVQDCDANVLANKTILSFVSGFSGASEDHWSISGYDRTPAVCSGNNRYRLDIARISGNQAVLNVDFAKLIKIMA